jgi:hypothetical protein
VDPSALRRHAGQAEAAGAAAPVEIDPFDILVGRSRIGQDDAPCGCKLPDATWQFVMIPQASAQWAR